LHAGPRQHPGDKFVGEHAHQVVLQRHEEAARPRIALPAGATAQLIVDTARLVAFGADDVQAAHAGDLAAFLLHVLLDANLGDRVLPFVGGHVQARSIFVLEPSPGEGLGIAAEDDVGTAAGHIRRYGDSAYATGLG